MAQQNQGDRDKNQQGQDQAPGPQGQRNEQQQTGPWESEKDPEGRQKQGSREGGPARHGGPMGGDSDEKSQRGRRQGRASGTQQDGDKGDARARTGGREDP